jgi:hypothetical protein
MNIGSWVGKGWAEPATVKRWALVTTVLERIKRLSGYRLCVHSSHRAWEKSHGA